MAIQSRFPLSLSLSLSLDVWVLKGPFKLFQIPEALCLSSRSLFRSRHKSGSFDQSFGPTLGYLLFESRKSIESPTFGDKSKASAAYSNLNGSIADTGKVEQLRADGVGGLLTLRCSTLLWNNSSLFASLTKPIISLRCTALRRTRQQQQQTTTESQRNLKDRAVSLTGTRPSPKHSKIEHPFLR